MNKIDKNYNGNMGKVQKLIACVLIIAIIVAGLFSILSFLTQEAQAVAFTEHTTVDENMLQEYDIEIPEGLHLLNWDDFYYAIGLGKEFGRANPNATEREIDDYIRVEIARIADERMSLPFVPFFTDIIPNAQVYLLLVLNPSMGLNVMNAGMLALSATEYFYGNSRRSQCSGDAFRHGFWNALMIHVGIPYSTAERFATAWESHLPAHCRDVEMDLNNNRAGRRLGGLLRNVDAQQLPLFILNAVSNGEFEQLENAVQLSDGSWTGELVRTNRVGLLDEFHYLNRIYVAALRSGGDMLKRQVVHIYLSVANGLMKHKLLPFAAPWSGYTFSHWRIYENRPNGLVLQQVWGESQVAVISVMTGAGQPVTLTAVAIFTPPTCVVTGTLITLADGSRVSVEQLTGNEYLLVWCFNTGRFTSSRMLFIEMGERREYEVVDLRFANGTNVKIIDSHGFFSMCLGRYVRITAYNAHEFIGQYFLSERAAPCGAIQIYRKRLVGAEQMLYVTEAWNPIVAEHLSFFANGVLSAPGAFVRTGFLNIFEICVGRLMVCEVNRNALIEQFGLMSHEDFTALVPNFPVEMFYAFNGQYINIALGTGNMTLEGLLELIGGFAGQL